MNLAPEAISEIDNLLKTDLPGIVATRLHRIVAALYEISLLQDQITRHMARAGTRGSAAGPSSAESSESGQQQGASWPDLARPRTNGSKADPACHEVPSAH